MSAQLEFYTAAVSPMLRAVRALEGILTKAKESPQAPSLPEARIAEDMYPLTVQVHLIADWVAKLVGKFNDSEPVVWVREDVKTWDDMFKLERASIEALEGLDRQIVNRAFGKSVNVTWGGGKSLDTKMEDYVLSLSQPNIYFHVAAAYNICRKAGVPLGKIDWIAPHVTHLLS